MTETTGVIQPPKPYGPVPSQRQLHWHLHPFYGFLHFTVNTFTDREWGYGDESPDVFNPTAFDAEQIVSTAADAGMSGLILTCKHHDGFCLWPSRYTEHSVKNSSWREGKGDVVREISDACRKHGIQFGVYLSPWDRNHADYGRPAYIAYFRNQLHELTTEYGELFEVWFDGANGGDGYYGGACESRSIDRRTYYDWQNTWQIVRRNQPNATMFSDAGPDVRWVGNEKGFAGDPCWSTLSADALYPGFGGDDWFTENETDMVKAWASDRDMLNQGDRQGKSWLPAECDVSIRPGWFYHASEDDQVRSPENLIDLYFKSIGRGASFLLNLPPDRRGQVHESDVQSLKGFRKRIDEIFDQNLALGADITGSNIRGDSSQFGPQNLVDNNPETYWATDDNADTAEVIFEFPEAITFNIVSLREFLPLGQRVDRFAIDIDSDGSWCAYCCEAAIGSCRLIRGQKCTTKRVRFRIVESSVCLAISELGLFYDPKMPN
ncbi:MAG: alpha-L-fucosidase [Candidatus Latescibacteria bacterium]|jgi:alpha-L-fucosidase|nr:alpha-L-fucosidase [Candidatus Latescibacterota bacterium]